MRKANCKMIARKLKRQQRRSTATERLSVWVKPRKGMLRNKTNKPWRRRKEKDRHRTKFLKEKSEREIALRKDERVIWSWDEKSQKEDISDKNATTSCKSAWDTVPYFGLNDLSILPVIPSPPLIKVASNTRPHSKLGGTTMNGREEEGQSTSHRPRIWSKKGPFFPRSIWTFFQLVVWVLHTSIVV